MTQTLHGFLIGSGVLFFLLIVYLLLRHKISERYSIIWLIGGIGILTVAYRPHILDRLATLVGVSYPPSLLFMLSTLILLIMHLYQSIELSKLQQKVVKLTQALVFLELDSEEKNRLEEERKGFKDQVAAARDQEPS